MACPSARLRARLRARPLVTQAYLLVSAAALVRVLGAWLPGLDYPAVIVLSAALWTVAAALVAYGVERGALLGEGTPGTALPA